MLPPAQSQETAVFTLKLFSISLICGIGFIFGARIGWGAFDSLDGMIMRAAKWAVKRLRANG